MWNFSQQHKSIKKQNLAICNRNLINKHNRKEVPSLKSQGSSGIDIEHRNKPFVRSYIFKLKNTLVTLIFRHFREIVEYFTQLLNQLNFHYGTVML